MDQINEVIFEIAEVITHPKNDHTYEYIEDSNSADFNAMDTFTIAVRTYTDYYNNQVIFAKPANTNIKQIPLIGEHVLIFSTTNTDSTTDVWSPQWYYFPVIGLRSNMNENGLPGISDSLTDEEIQNLPRGNTFKKRNVSALQPYEGDLLIEGRWGNRIRLGSTIVGNSQWMHTNKWSSTGDSGDPIIILSNSTVAESGNNFTIENASLDNSSFYLTSTQAISELLLGSPNKRNPLRCNYPSESQFAQSQFIGIADRIILKANTDIAVIDSPKAIILNTTGEVKLGNDEANESMVHGDVLLNVLQQILNQLNKPIQCGTMTGTFIDKSNIINAQQLLQKLLSSKYFLEKNTY